MWHTGIWSEKEPDFIAQEEEYTQEDER